MLSYVFGVAAGIVYGGLAGLGKYFFLWRKLLNENSPNTTNTSMNSITTRLIISYVVNIAVMVATLLLRHSEKVDFVAFAIATALTLSLSGRIFSIQKVLSNVKIEDKNSK